MTSINSSTFRRFQMRSPIASSTIEAVSTTEDEAVGGSGTAEEPECYDFNQPNKLTTVSRFKSSLDRRVRSRMSLQECQTTSLVLS